MAPTWRRRGLRDRAHGPATVALALALLFALALALAVSACGGADVGPAGSTATGGPGGASVTNEATTPPTTNPRVGTIAPLPAEGPTPSPADARLTADDVGTSWRQATPVHGASRVPDFDQPTCTALAPEVATTAAEQDDASFLDPTGVVTIDQHVVRFGDPNGVAVARAHVGVVGRQGFDACAVAALDKTDANLVAGQQGAVRVTVDETDPVGVNVAAYTVSFAAITGKADVDVTMHVWILQRDDLVDTIAITANGLRGQSRALLDAVDTPSIVRAAVRRLRAAPGS